MLTATSELRSGLAGNSGTSRFRNVPPVAFLVSRPGLMHTQPSRAWGGERGEREGGKEGGRGRRGGGEGGGEGKEGG